MKYLSKVIYILIFLVMVTSPYAGHTYAEYAKEASGSDTARISSFGITVTTNENSFSTSYGSPEVNVRSSNDENVLAPGTAGIFCEYHVLGTPEVRTKVTKNADVVLNDYWTTGAEDNGSFYCPLVFAFKTNGTAWATINGLDYSSPEELEVALEENLKLGDAITHETGYNYETGTDYQHNNCIVTWHWPFVGATGSEINQTMERDNALGDKSTRPTLSITFDTTIEQID